MAANTGQGLVTHLWLVEMLSELLLRNGACGRAAGVRGSQPLDNLGPRAMLQHQWACLRKVLPHVPHQALQEARKVPGFPSTSGTKVSIPTKTAALPSSMAAGTNTGAGANLAEVAVAVDVLLLMTVLQLVVFDVEPQRLHDVGPGLGVHAQQASQARVQFVLRWLQ